MSKQVNVDSAKTANLTDKEIKAKQKADRQKAFESERSALIAKQDNTGKSKAELKAERRAKQEAQRNAKTGARDELKLVIQTNKSHVIEENNRNSVSNDSTARVVTQNSVEKGPQLPAISKELAQTSSRLVVKKGQIFKHIPQRISDLTQFIDEISISGLGIHYSIIEIGFKMNANVIKGSNARCVAMLIAFKKVIQDYTTPPSKELARDLESTLDSYVKFLFKCRPLSISMFNAVKHLKLAFSRLPSNMNDYNAKSELCSTIDNFIADEIICAQRGIAELAITKVNDQNDVILTFGCSLIVKHVLYRAAKRGKKFRVIVVDARPRFDGREMLKYLLKHNISVSYVLINAVSYVMKEVTKVLLGAHSLLANGYVMSHIGSSQIALVAHSYNIPVLVCCETYKFSERVHTDSFVHNELGDNRDFLNNLNYEKNYQLDSFGKELTTLDLLYDVTPHEFVSVVITEKGVLPCTSAPAVLRVRETK